MFNVTTPLMVTRPCNLTVVSWTSICASLVSLATILISMLTARPREAFDELEHCALGGFGLAYRCSASDLEGRCWQKN
jgi:hypothetical protein